MRRFIAWKQAVINRLIHKPWIVGVSQTLTPPVPPFNPADMFTPTTPGWVYDLSDFSTLFQDSAGTTPVTAVEQPVGKILDLSGNGHHASQPTSTKRPVLSSRVNLLTNSAMTGAVAGTPGTQPTGYALVTTAPASTDSITTDANGNAVITTTVTNGRLAYRSDITLAANTSYYAQMTIVSAVNQGLTYLENVLRFVALPVGATEKFFANGVEKTAGMYVPQSGDVIATLVVTSATGGSSQLRFGPGVNANALGTYTFTRPQYNYGSAPERYQRTGVTATSYDTAGFPLYLKRDGVDDFESTAAVDFTGADSVTIWQGVQKLSDTESGVLCELGAESITLNGTFGLFAPEPSGTGYMFNSRGTSRAFVISPSHPAPHKCVLTAQGRISTDTCAIQINEAVVMTNAADQGINAYTLNPMYFGARGGTSNFFGGEQYSSVGIGKPGVTPEELYNTRDWVNDRTGAY